MKKMLSFAILAIFILTLITPFALADEQVASQLPYQEFIDKGWLYKEPWNKQGSWDIVSDKIMDISYSSCLKQNDRLIIIDGSEDYARLRDLTEEYKVSEYYQSIYKPDTQEFWDRMGIKANYLITINCQDWQNTKYKDMILEATFKEWPMLNDPAYLKYILDPKYNGKTNKYIYFCDGVDLYLNSDRMDVRYELKETQKKLPIKVFSDGGHSMIPLRGVLEELGAVVNYNSKSKEITIKDKGHTVILQLGSDTAKVDGVTKKMPKPVYTKNGYTVIPLRFVSENLDHGIGFFPEYGNQISIGRAKEGPPTR